MSNRCKAITKDGRPCKNYAVEGSDYCVFHGGRKNSPSKSLDLSQGEIRIAKPTYIPWVKDRKTIGETASSKIVKYENYYKSGGLVSAAVDARVYAAVGNGFQIIDVDENSRNTERAKVIEKLSRRINLPAILEKIFRNLEVAGVAWGEMVLRGNSIMGFNLFPPRELEVERDNKTGEILTVKQVRGGEAVATWEKNAPENSDKTLKNIMIVSGETLYSELYGISFIEKIYDMATETDKTEENLITISEYVAYPFRIVKVGNNEYPASTNAVEKIADKVQNLNPGEWLVTRHNMEFQFEAPEAPTAMADMYTHQTKNLIVSMGVPSMYASMGDIDSQTMREIRTIFNTSIRALQRRVAHVVENTLFRRELELKGYNIGDECPVKISWNPLTVSVLSILELTQLLQAGVISINEARQILESMGYTTLPSVEHGDMFYGPPEKKTPKESKPTEDDPEKPPNDRTKPRSEDEPPKVKKPSTEPRIVKPQPNQPKMTYKEWLEGIKVLMEIDKKEAYNLLMRELADGFDRQNF